MAGGTPEATRLRGPNPRTGQWLRDRSGDVPDPFGTLKAWMGSIHFLTKRLQGVGTEMRLHVLAYNLKRVMNILGVRGLIQALPA